MLDRLLLLSLLREARAMDKEEPALLDHYRSLSLLPAALEKPQGIVGIYSDSTIFVGEPARVLRFSADRP